MAQNEDLEDDVYASMICDDGSWQSGDERAEHEAASFTPKYLPSESDSESASESFTPPLGELVAELVGVNETSDAIGNSQTDLGDDDQDEECLHCSTNDQILIGSLDHAAQLLEKTTFRVKNIVRDIRVRKRSKSRSSVSTDSASSSTSIGVLHGEMDARWGGVDAAREMDARVEGEVRQSYKELKQDIAALVELFVDDMLADLGSRVLVATEHQEAKLTLLTLRLTAKLSLVKLSFAAAHEKRITPAHILGGGAAPRGTRLGAGVTAGTEDGGEVEKREAVGGYRASESASVVSVKQVMDNLRVITLNLNRDFDAWKAEDAKSLADTVGLICLYNRTLLPL